MTRMPPKQVTIMEIGPRDELQNEMTHAPTEIKIQWIEKLVDAELSHIEPTSFAPPKWVPALSDHTDDIYLLNRLDIEIGIDLAKLIEASSFILPYLNQKNRSKAANALQSL